MTGLLKFGDFVFSVKSLAFETLSKSCDRNLEITKTVGGSYVSGNTRPEQTIEISGEAVMKRGDVFDTLNGIKGSQNVTATNGRNFGKFVLKTFSVESGTFFPDGTPRTQKFSLTLLRDFG